MTLTEFIFNANTLVGIGAVIIALAYTYSQIRTGFGKASTELISLYQTQLEAQKEVNKNLQEQVNIMRQDLGKLQGLYEASEKKIKEYMELFGPAGELKTTLAKLEEASLIATKAEEFMNSFPKVLENLVKKTTLTAEVKAK